ncbi:CaiB/BaiF CoA-transferase family protein [Actinacidiphila sp. DG2A-62]|uniref:CaiB/BaiF CoA transferase family protein n=1 Tax=Actinacidiphila sp. DG2A-62 TaxID=3108821 RepID=UPI002DBBE418|nr:CaiB/BaiF CoA-transferase family protein [Actinacidiphila sp. DG2A-62]MEC3997076.1 CaiB/BaiF CoA-transferase family protein [Actinacidiphila sp. DG2A-62]
MTRNEMRGPVRAERPLSGVRVIELGNYIAAPTAGRLLADFGAEVIKIERPGTGDELRNWRLYAGSTSMLYRTINRNKKSVVLDLRTPEGRRAVLELIGQSDVLIENFRPGTLERWGMGPDYLTEINPELILVRISGFGQTGPLASRPGFAAVAEAWGGLRALVGEPDRPPSRTGVSLGDSLGGLYGAFGAVMSLFERERRRQAGERGRAPAERTVDVALHEAVFSVMESLVADFTAYGIERERTGGRLEGIAPSNAYRCKDGNSVVISGNGDSIFVRLMEAIGRPDLARDPNLATNAQRWAARDILDDALETWTSTLVRTEVLKALDQADVPAGPINTAADILVDPQFIARGMLQDFQTEINGRERTVTFPGIVPLLGPVSLPIDHPGPDLGEHTEEILHSLRKR